MGKKRKWNILAAITAAACAAILLRPGSAAAGGEKEKARSAFRMQNRCRTEAGVGKLEWSEELYRFCLYRLRHSGFDRHRSLAGDIHEYFGDFASFRGLSLVENQYSGSGRQERAVRAWKGSPAHYRNLVAEGHRCGATACIGNVWCAVFYDGDASRLEGWESMRIRAVTVKRYDSGKKRCIGGSAIGYYEKGDRWGTLQAAVVKKSSGKTLYLEEGKRYVIYERKAPPGHGRAASVEIRPGKDGPDEIILKEN